jgi:alpha-glucosidase
MTSFDGRSALVLLNFSDKEQKVELKDGSWGQRLIGKNDEKFSDGLTLKPYEGVVYAG